jgi:hypothetical protein
MAWEKRLGDIFGAPCHTYLKVAPFPEMVIFID